MKTVEQVGMKIVEKLRAMQAREKRHAQEVLATRLRCYVPENVYVQMQHEIDEHREGHHELTLYGTLAGVRVISAQGESEIIIAEVR